MKRRKKPYRPSGRRPPLKIADILAWADEFYARVGRWPSFTDGKIVGQLGLTWSVVNNALTRGYRGLRPGSSLAKLLLEHRGRTHRLFLPRFSIQRILAWADAYHERTGQWPTRNSGRIATASADTWFIVDKALRNGGRGLSAGSSLARLLTQRRGVRNLSELPPLTVEQILAWADAHRQRTGSWPRRSDGAIADAPGETWAEVDNALRYVKRTLPPDYGSLAQLLAKTRGMRNKGALPPLILRHILTWARAYHQRTGKWPTHISGPIADAPGETWCTVHNALYKGLRGFPGGSSLYQVLQSLRQGTRATSE
jgi:hypothetical protein